MVWLICFERLDRFYWFDLIDSIDLISLILLIWFDLTWLILSIWLDLFDLILFDLIDLIGLIQLDGIDLIWLSWLLRTGLIDVIWLTWLDLIHLNGLISRFDWIDLINLMIRLDLSVRFDGSIWLIWSVSFVDWFCISLYWFYKHLDTSDQTTEKR